MRVYLCNDDFDNILTGIFYAWSYALEAGHDAVRLERGTGGQLSLFDEYLTVETDYDKSQRVATSIKNKISGYAYVWIYRAAMSVEPTAPDDIYRFMILGYKCGSRVTNMLTEPAVMRMMELNRRVGNEAHFFREFARFNSVDNMMYVCHLEPKSNVILSVADHFADRMPSENFIIIDDNRKIAAVHPKEGDCYLRELTDEEFKRLSISESYEDEFTAMWRTFFDAIAIKQRENPACQRNHFPIWMRKHATEFVG